MEFGPKFEGPGLTSFWIKESQNLNLVEVVADGYCFLVTARCKGYIIWRKIASYYISNHSCTFAIFNVYLKIMEDLGNFSL